MWVALYEEKRRKWDNDREKFKWLNSTSVPYSNNLKENMPMACPNNWVVEKVKEKYGVFGCYPRAKQDALNIGLGATNQ